MEYDKDYFKGKTAVVTGAASGVGLALIEELLESGADKTVLSDINEENLAKHVTRLEGLYPGRVKGIVCDVTSEKAVNDLIAGSAEFFGGRIDLLFNNAGAMFSGWFEDVPIEKWDAALKLNFYSAVYGMRAALPIMKEQGGGQIVNIISGTAFSPMAEWSPYCASKAALNTLSLALRVEYWDDNIKINPATPGTTATAIFGDDKPADDKMQTPHQSASRILNGVANNDRIIFGDDSDVDGASFCFHPEAAKGNDEYYLRVARERRKGITAI